uniref:Uncharacterized protein n=1 Tax=Oryza punctata TaxID=4537 RepID=A0A0E0JI98_ORYPU
MEVIVSAVMGELASRTISFLIDKYSVSVTATTMEEERLDNLQRLLLRVRIIIEDAEERHVMNQAMLHQLNILRKEMYRGYYTLDTLRFRAHDLKKEKDHGEEITYGAEHLGVLPIIGPGKVGKITLLTNCVLQQRWSYRWKHSDSQKIASACVRKHRSSGEPQAGIASDGHGQRVVAPLHIPRANKNLEPVAILNNYQRNCNEAHSYSGLITASSPRATSQITVQDIMFGTATPPGQFEVLAWRSHIPPYYSCVFDCEIKRPLTRIYGL